MQRFLLLSLLSISMAATAVSLPRESIGEDTVRYSAYIETPRAAVSGICILVSDSTEIRGCLFNEFGITALEFTYNRRKDKVRLHTVLPALDRWYIRRTLRRDLRQLLLHLQQGDGTYENSRYHIKYTLTPLL